MPPEAMEALIRAIGRVPVQRDTLYGRRRRGGGRRRRRAGAGAGGADAAAQGAGGGVAEMARDTGIVRRTL